MSEEDTMPEEPTPATVHVGRDLSGTVVIGHRNHVTPSASAPTEREPRQQISTETGGTAYSLAEGTMNVNVYAALNELEEPEEPEEPQEL